MENNSKKEGYLEIFPEINYGDDINITIIGDPKGLRHLAVLLNELANVCQDDILELPIGEREHIHLHKSGQLGDHSCEVEICRADAKGTGEYPALG